uniref:Variant surface glycoprotein 582 n=1 Tax=Trypanosoma brucei TaxID=5691 RepID=M4TDK2_9TRYP|nr:variant surface glycoprotein 582 [Trypanosoma brucei]
MVSPTQFIATVLLFNYLARRADADGKAAIKKEAAAKVCTLSEAMKKVPSLAANFLKQKQAKISKYSKLYQLLKRTAASADGAVDSKMELLLLVTAELQRQTQHSLAADTTSAIRAAAACSNVAGRIEEFIHIMFQAKGSGNNACIRTGGSAASAADLSCLKTDGTLKDITVVDTVNTPEQVSEAYNALKAARAELDGDTTADACNILDNSNTGNAFVTAHGGDLTIAWGGGILERSGGQANLAQAHWKLGSSATAADSVIRECASTLQALKPAQTAAKTLDSQLDNLLSTATDLTFADVEIAAKAAGSEPQEKMDITGSELSAIHKKLKSYQATAAEGDSTLDKLETAELRRSLRINKTECAIGRQTTAAAEEVRKEREKKEKECNTAKSRSDCKAKTGCAYDDTKEEGKKCEFNETKAEKSGVPATQAQAGGTETTTEKCKGKEQKDCKDGCNWDGKECKDYSFLLNKQFALTVVSTAFVALLF